MFMQVIPTYRVVFGTDQEFRVSDNDLMAFLGVLRFNGFTDFSVTLENPLHVPPNLPVNLSQE
jgi:hypothetical protein